MKIMNTILGEKLFNMLMKSTFYGHFVAGEDQVKIVPTLERWDFACMMFVCAVDEIRSSNNNWFDNQISNTCYSNERARHTETSPLTRPLAIVHFLFFPRPRPRHLFCCRFLSTNWISFPMMTLMTSTQVSKRLLLIIIKRLISTRSSIILA